jgi:hypothetical protein
MRSMHIAIRDDRLSRRLHVRVKVCPLGQKSSLTRVAGVAHEQLTKAVRVEHDDDAILVHVVTRIDEERQLRR